LAELTVENDRGSGSHKLLHPFFVAKEHLFELRGVLNIYRSIYMPSLEFIIKSGVNYDGPHLSALQVAREHLGRD
jgi:hypothetical protein